MRLRYGQELLNDRFRYEVLYKAVHDYSPSYRAKIQSPIKNEIVKLRYKFRVKYITETAPMPLMRINYIYAEDEKLVQELGKVCWRHYRSMYPHLTEDMKYSSRSRFWRLCSEKYDGQPVIIWNDRRGSQLREELGSETFITFFWYHTTSRAEYKNIHQSSWLTKWNINSVQPLQILSMVLAVRIFWATTKTKTKHADAFQLLFRCVLSDFGHFD